MEIISVDGIRVSIGSHENKTIIIGADHRGFIHKTKIIEALKLKGHKLIDVGTFSPERCDYPIISDKIGKLVEEDLGFTKIGIGICGSGIGILTPASKHQGVYPAKCLTTQEAETSRKHNNTNVLGIGADYVSLESALAIIETWLKTPFYSNPTNEKPYLDRFVQTVKLENQTINHIK